MSAGLICLGSKPTLNFCGICGGANDWLLTGTPGCWLTSIRTRSSLACESTCTLESARLTVPVTELATGAAGWDDWSGAGLPASLEGPPQPPSNNAAIASGKASLRMGKSFGVNEEHASKRVDPQCYRAHP